MEAMDNAMQTRLPQFLCVGTYRAGTTWLHAMLGSHPDVFLPAEKETMFFSHHHDKGLDWYARFFRDAGPDSLRGEICPTYLTPPEAAGRIHEAVPGAAILIILRSPLAQAPSLYRLWVLRGKTDLPLARAVRECPELLDNVRYHEHVERYLRLFGPDRVKVLLYDDLCASPRAFLQAVHGFLGLAPHLPPGLDERINTARRPRLRAVDKAIAKGGDFLRRHGLLGVKCALNRLGVVRWMKERNEAPDRPDMPVDMDPETRSLLRSVTAEQQDRLGALLGLDLSGWSSEDAP